MRLFVVFFFVAVGVCSEPTIRDLTDTYLQNLADDSTMDFKFYLVHRDYHKDESVKHTNTIGYGLNPNKTCNFKLASLGEKKIAALVKMAEDVGVVLTVLEVNRQKNISNAYDTKQQEELTSPAAEILNNADGLQGGIIEETFDVLYETKNVANITSFEFNDSKKLKRRTTMTIHAQEIMVKDQKNMSTAMIEQAKKLLKKALKVDVENKAMFVVNQFENRYPHYKWSVLVNPVAYTHKSDRMVSLKYEGTIYTILATAINS